MFTDLRSIEEPLLAFLMPTLVSGPTQLGFFHWYNRYEKDVPVTDKASNLLLKTRVAWT